MLEREIAPAHQHTDLRRAAGRLAGEPAGTLQQGDVRRTVEHDVPRHGIRDDLIQVGSGNVVIEGDDRAGEVRGQHFPVVMVRPPAPRLLGPEAREHPANRVLDVLVRPAAIHIPVKTVQDSGPTALRTGLPLRNDGARGGEQQMAALAHEP